MRKTIILSPAVEKALAAKLPVVALESTVLTHGLPHPQNLEILQELENILASEGVTAATIIVFEGHAHIGLEPELLQKILPLLQEPGYFKKLGMRDLALAAALKQSGGTTVSATMKLAALAGIEIFATGGIGGVHRGWEQSLDISSDLWALANLPVAVVSAGCKAILDVSATLECLETLAVPVLGWKTHTFPLFYTPDSKFGIPCLKNTEDFAQLWNHHNNLGGKGLLVANPIPENDALNPVEIEAQIGSCLSEAQQKSIHGKALTPFLLDCLARTTKGDSVKANLALLKNNAQLAAKLAKTLSKRG
ncbi:MAG: pseudouridine-5'-phosphate glycosidase [Candidatus Cloacimonetes bacterium]|nr:pseudouridine-5'-phosphate glycosidase [Candidatus Cloacimonadota bacterium]